MNYIQDLINAQIQQRRPVLETEVQTQGGDAEQGFPSKVSLCTEYLERTIYMALQLFLCLF